MTQVRRAAILGAGGWGTSIARLLADNGFETRLWARDSAFADTLERERQNSVYLPGAMFPENIRACSDMALVLSGAEVVVSAVPSHGLRAVLEVARPFIGKEAILVSATKGIEAVSLLTPTGIIRDVLGNQGIVALSGPSFAKEVSQGLPAAVCAASSSLEAAQAVQSAFSTRAFRVYTNADVIGVELGGALKNVMAIASGISDGLSLGLNARAALITRGLAEMTRLGVKMGAQAATFSGLSGLGDLVLTCTGALSRNYSTGVALGKGKTIEEAQHDRQVSEGVKTAEAAWSLAEKRGVETPIINEVYAVLYEGKRPKDACLELMTRGLKAE
ncbi:MAG: NAD(P)-dependent glycerol-3-phosphate dehydrogenase [Deltaproteobacteria bacterium]|nr:NAD(P)-dependent glycerol-3-phosphate dehydrogenase [Deltaproteobacteria bacterium]